MMVVGETGVGKTHLKEHFVSQDIAKGYNVVVFDPKGDQALFSKIYELAIKYDRREDLILVTPLYPELSALINPMQEYFMIDEPVDHVTASIPQVVTKSSNGLRKRLPWAHLGGNNPGGSGTKTPKS